MAPVTAPAPQAVTAFSIGSKGTEADYACRRTATPVSVITGRKKEPEVPEVAAKRRCGAPPPAARKPLRLPTRATNFYNGRDGGSRTTSSPVTSAAAEKTTEACPARPNRDMSCAATFCLHPSNDCGRATSARNWHRAGAVEGLLGDSQAGAGRGAGQQVGA